MAKHKVVTTDAQIDSAMERAAGLKDEPRVIEAVYRPGSGLQLFILKLNDGRRVVIPREDLEGLRDASASEIANVEIMGNGSGLRWPDLDLDHYVPALLQQIYGTRQWLVSLGRRGGSVKSDVKRTAARTNGSRGGRPRQKVPAAIKTA